MVAFHEGLSESAVYHRYFQVVKLARRTTHEALTRVCFVDYDREMALVAERHDPATGERMILGVGRLSKLHGTAEAEFALIVRDEAQGRGLGTELLRWLIAIGVAEHLHRIHADILPQNLPMQRMSEKFGFRLRPVEDVVRAELDLPTPA